MTEGEKIVCEFLGITTEMPVFRSVRGLAHKIDEITVRID
jgi:hypothetical protein